YSAGLKRRDTDAPVIIAGIQSVYRRACDLGPFDLVLVDEAHLIPTDGEGMYRRFLADAKVVNPYVRVVGFTATPFRLGSGLICSPDNILNQVCFEVGVRELIVQGYLCPLVSKAGAVSADTSRLHVRGGEFVAGEVEELMDTSELVEAACKEIIDYTADRNSVLIFASGVQHAEHVQQVLEENHGVECGLVTGQTPAQERQTLLRRFKAHPDDMLVRRGDVRPLKYLVNVNVLTTGFDAPNVDCVVLLRPTMSPGLFYQMVGRGFRLHHSKRNCLVLDFGGNVVRHGPVDAIKPPDKPRQGEGPAPAKQCPECNSVIAAGYAVCPDCGHAFPPPDRRRHDATASDAGVLSDQVTDTEYEVRDIVYRVHTKKDAPPDAPKTMRVDYMIGLDHWQSEWICFEHTGYARQKAVAWWTRRSPDPVPDTAERAVEIAEAGGLAHTERIVVRSVPGEKYDRIVGYKLGPLPEPVDVSPEFAPEEIPF
ncbi:MAG TPA: DNA helicase, partial [Planctomycetaceae bacterium]|nr:DNA helicase [Planctomycetaceae bacterium]